MGFETITAQIIFISALLYFGVLIVTTFNVSWMDIHKSLTVQKDIMKDKIDESLEIQGVSYNNGFERITVNVLNNGNNKIELEYIDLFVNITRIPRNISNRTITLDSSTELKNPGLWDPKEVVDIVIEQSLDPGVHYIEIFTKFGNRDIYNFTVV